MVKELAKKSGEPVSTISSANVVNKGRLSTPSSRATYDERPDQSQLKTVPVNEVLAERDSRAGKLVGGISSGGLSTRPSRKTHDPVKAQFEEPTNPSNSALPVKDDAEAPSTGADAGAPGTMMMGVKLQGAERWRAWGAVALLTLLAVLQYTGNFMPAYFNEQMLRDIGMTDAQYGLVQGYAYYLVYGLAMIAAGFITDKYKLNRCWVVGISSGLTGAALVLEACANNFTMFLAGIVLNALTSAVVQNIPFAILSDLLPPEQLGLGGAIFGSAPYVGEMLCGNVAYAVILHHKEDSSWRWPVCILGIGVFVVSGAVAVLIKDPPVGKFIHPSKDEGRTSVRDFNTKKSFGYLVAMSTFWIMTLATSFRLMSGSIIAAYMPDYNQALFPDQPTVFAAEASVVGVCGFVAATYYGVITERLFARLPTISLYTTAIGSIFASGFMALAVFARYVRSDSNGGFAVFLTGLALSILCSEGWIGPVTCLVTLILPPEIKSFGVSMWNAIGNIIMPAGNVLFGIYFTAGGWYSETPAWLPAARPFLLGSIVFGYLSSAALYLASARLMHRDLDKLATVQQAGSLDAVAPSKRRQVYMLIGVVFASAATLMLIAMSFIFSYEPWLVVSGYKG